MTTKRTARTARTALDPEDREAPRTHPWRFLAPVDQKNYTAPIDRDYQHYNEVVKGLNSAYLKFREGGKATTDPYVAGYVRWLIVKASKDGRVLGIREDLSAFPMLCPYALTDGCEWRRETSTKADEEARYQHIMADHIELLSADAEALNPIRLLEDA